MSEMSFGTRVLIAFESLLGIFIASHLVAPIGYGVFLMIFGVAFSGIGGKPMLPADRSIAVIRVLAGGFALFATAAFLLMSLASVSIGRRWRKATDESAAAVAFATVLAFYIAIGLFFLSPYYSRDYVDPLLAIGAVTWFGALAGTLPARPARRVSPWVLACVTLLIASPLAVELGWRIQQSVRANADKREPPIDAPPASRQIASTEAFGLTLLAVSRAGTLYYDDAGGRLHARSASGLELWVHDTNDERRRFRTGAVGAERCTSPAPTS